MAELIPKKGDEPDRFQEGDPIELGQWYWTKREKQDWFGCVVHIGSNFIQLENVYGSGIRFHVDEFEKECRREADPEKVIRGRIEYQQNTVRQKLAKIREITARLGLSDKDKIEQKPTESRELSTLSSKDNVKAYKKDLIRAKEKTLPKLFQEVEEAHKDLASWMKAQTLPMKSQVEILKEAVGEIEDRIFSVSLYAGLTEEVERITNGEAAPASEKLHIMQRRLYMDEECLLNYRHGGMEFGYLPEFDRWLAKPENRDRILPFPRTIVVFRVRRKKKERPWGGGLLEAFVNVRLEAQDELTFLYIRNGERVFRMSCDLEFGDTIFPGRHELDLSEPMMAEMFCSSVRRILPKREYDDMLKDREEKTQKYQEWKKANPDKSWIEYGDTNVSWGWHDQFEPFNKSSVYYDEIKAEIESRVKYYNRIALIVQGLYDRSPVLHPHAPVRIWTAEGFKAAVELVYDGGDTIHHGDAPDFEVYRQRCNQSLGPDSITIGQDDFWQEKEAEKENARRSGRQYDLDRYKPTGNPGPGYLARIHHWGRKNRKATFRWSRQRQYYGGYFSKTRPGDPMPCTIMVAEDRLFNVSAYKLGDYKRFFEDPRSRAQYLKWAPALLAAEEFHAGNLEVGERPSEELFKKKRRKKKRDERRKAK